MPRFSDDYSDNQDQEQSAQQAIADNQQANDQLRSVDDNPTYQDSQSQPADYPQSVDDMPTYQDSQSEPAPPVEEAPAPHRGGAYQGDGTDEAPAPLPPPPDDTNYSTPPADSRGRNSDGNALPPPPDDSLASAAYDSYTTPDQGYDPGTYNDPLPPPPVQDMAAQYYDQSSGDQPQGGTTGDNATSNELPPPPGFFQQLGSSIYDQLNNNPLTNAVNAAQDYGATVGNAINDVTGFRDFQKDAKTALIDPYAQGTDQIANVLTGNQDSNYPTIAAGIGGAADALSNAMPWNDGSSDSGDRVGREYRRLVAQGMNPEQAARQATAQLGPVAGMVAGTIQNPMTLAGGVGGLMGDAAAPYLNTMNQAATMVDPMGMLTAHAASQGLGALARGAGDAFDNVIPPHPDSLSPVLQTADAGLPVGAYGRPNVARFDGPFGGDEVSQGDINEFPHLTPPNQPSGMFNPPKRVTPQRAPVNSEPEYFRDGPPVTDEGRFNELLKTNPPLNGTDYTPEELAFHAEEAATGGPSYNGKTWEEMSPVEQQIWNQRHPEMADPLTNTYRQYDPQSTWTVPREIQAERVYQSLTPEEQAHFDSLSPDKQQILRDLVGRNPPQRPYEQGAASTGAAPEETTYPNEFIRQAQLRAQRLRGQQQTIPPRDFTGDTGTAAQQPVVTPQDGLQPYPGADASYQQFLAKTGLQDDPYIRQIHDEATGARNPDYVNTPEWGKFFDSVHNDLLGRDVTPDEMKLLHQAFQEQRPVTVETQGGGRWLRPISDEELDRMVLNGEYSTLPPSAQVPAADNLNGPQAFEALPRVNPRPGDVQTLDDLYNTQFRIPQNEPDTAGRPTPEQVLQAINGPAPAAFSYSPSPDVRSAPADLEAAFQTAPDVQSLQAIHDQALDTYGVGLPPDELKQYLQDNFDPATGQRIQPPVDVPATQAVALPPHPDVMQKMTRDQAQAAGIPSYTDPMDPTPSTQWLRNPFAKPSPKMLTTTAMILATAGIGYNAGWSPEMIAKATNARYGTNFSGQDIRMATLRRAWASQLTPFLGAAQQQKSADLQLQGLGILNPDGTENAPVADAATKIAQYASALRNPKDPRYQDALRIVPPLLAKYPQLGTKIDTASFAEPHLPAGTVAKNITDVAASNPTALPLPPTAPGAVAPAAAPVTFADLPDSDPIGKQRPHYDPTTNTARWYTHTPNGWVPSASIPIVKGNQTTSPVAQAPVVPSVPAPSPVTRPTVLPSPAYIASDKARLAQANRDGQAAIAVGAYPAAGPVSPFADLPANAEIGKQHPHYDPATNTNIFYTMTSKGWVPSDSIPVGHIGKDAASSGSTDAPAAIGKQEIKFDPATNTRYWATYTTKGWVPSDQIPLRQGARASGGTASGTARSSTSSQYAFTPGGYAGKRNVNGTLENVYYGNTPSSPLVPQSRLRQPATSSAPRSTTAPRASSAGYTTTPRSSTAPAFQPGHYAGRAINQATGQLENFYYGATPKDTMIWEHQAKGQNATATNNPARPGSSPMAGNNPAGSSPSNLPGQPAQVGKVPSVYDAPLPGKSGFRQDRGTWYAWHGENGGGWMDSAGNPMAGQPWTTPNGASGPQMPAQQATGGIPNTTPGSRPAVSPSFTNGGNAGLPPHPNAGSTPGHSGGYTGGGLPHRQSGRRGGNRPIGQFPAITSPIGGGGYSGTRGGYQLAYGMGTNPAGLFWGAFAPEDKNALQAYFAGIGDRTQAEAIAAKYGIDSLETLHQIWDQIPRWKSLPTAPVRERF